MTKKEPLSNSRGPGVLKCVLGSVLLATATQGWALSLGPSQGRVVIGRPLDVLVQASVEPSEAAAGLCLEAEVVYGDVRVPPSAIATAIQRMSDGGEGWLRVRASLPVDEPLVMVKLKAGCQTSFTRQYTLLADVDALPAASPRGSGALVLPPEAAVAAAPRRQSDAPVVGSRAARSATAPAGTAAPRGATPRSEAQSPIRLPAPAPRPAGIAAIVSKTKPQVSQRSVGPAASAPTPVPQVSAAPAVSQPRLKLDPVDVSPGLVGQVLGANPTEAKVTSEADAPAVAPGAQRSASGEGEGTRAPSAPVPAANTDWQQLRAEQDRLRVALETLNAELARAEANRYNNPLVYGLAGLVAALLVALAALWRQRQRVTPGIAAVNQTPAWWSVEPAVPDAVGTEPVAPQVATPPVAAGPALPHGLAGLEVIETHPDEASPPTPPVVPASSAAGVPVSAVPGDVLLDLFQHVVFFESLGQWPDAIQALRSFVRAHPRSSEAPYLLWLHLAERHSPDPQDWQQARAAYERDFGTPVPPMSPSEAGLEADSALVRRLCGVWATGQARHLIEAALTSQPNDLDPVLTHRTWCSFEDLLMLHGVLDLLPALPQWPSAVAGVGAVPAASTDFPTLPQARPADWSTVANASAAAAVAEPTAPGLGLDLDLSGLGQASGSNQPSPVTAQPGLDTLDFNLGDLGQPVGEIKKSGDHLHKPD